MAPKRGRPAQVLPRPDVDIGADPVVRIEQQMAGVAIDLAEARRNRAHTAVTRLGVLFAQLGEKLDTARRDAVRRQQNGGAA